MSPTSSQAQPSSSPEYARSTFVSGSKHSSSGAAPAAAGEPPAGGLPAAPKAPPAPPSDGCVGSSSTATQTLSTQPTAPMNGIGHGGCFGSQASASNSAQVVSSSAARPASTAFAPVVDAANWVVQARQLAESSTISQSLSTEQLTSSSSRSAMLASLASSQSSSHRAELSGLPGAGAACARRSHAVRSVVVGLATVVASGQAK